MKQALLENFKSLDGSSFSALVHHLGFAAAAYYRLNVEILTMVLASEDEASAPWPPLVALLPNYTSADERLPPRGFMRLIDLPIKPEVWPKSAVCYVPEQVFEADRLLFVGVLASGKRVRFGELDGALEAMSTRLRSWLRDHGERHAVSEGAVKAHLKRVETDLRMVIDHELRTPLASVSGYVSLLGTLDDTTPAAVRLDYLHVLETETARAIEAIDKISLALYTDKRLEQTSELAVFDAASAVQELCVRLTDHAADVIGSALAQSLSVQYTKATDVSCQLQGDRSLFMCAVWEVIKNAAAHARGGKVAVRTYTAQHMLIVDIEDDGAGVSVGAEDLIFLRFYQDPGLMHKRRGRRGLGLGLFLSRHIAEQHMGQLLFIRQKNGSLFRFLWPLGKEG